MISFIVPTIGRPSLANTLASIECWPGDEILVVGGPPVSDARVRHIPCAPGGDWGHSERNFVAPYIRGQYVAHIDDDDCYAPGTRALMADAIYQTPGHPVLFRMQYPNGVTLWRHTLVIHGNVGTPMMLIPNEPDKFGVWGSFDGGDCHFLETMKWQREQIVWRPEVIAHLGHNSAWAERELVRL
jgi:hypothetical protein